MNESRALLEFAQEKKMSPNMLMFVRTAVDKIESTLKEFEKRKLLEAAAEERKKTNSPAPAIFTDKEISVKPLKGEGAKVRLPATAPITPHGFAASAHNLR